MTAPDSRAGLVRLLNDLETMRRLLRLYPGGHPSLEPAEDRITGSTGALLALSSPLTVGLGPDKAFLDGEEVPLPAMSPAGRVARLLFQLGMAGFRLDKPRGAEGVVALGRELAGLREPPGEADRERLLAAAGRLPGLELLPIDLSSVQLVDQESLERGEGVRLIWRELAARLASSGVFALSGRLAGGELTAGAVLELVDRVSSPDSLFDHLFVHLAAVLREAEASRRSFALAEARAFLGEFIGLLDPARRALAVTVAACHLPVAGSEEPASPMLVSAEILLDAVELMLLQQLAVPDSIERTVRRMAAAEAGADPAFTPELIARAGALVARLDGPAPPVPDALPADADLEVPWQGAPWLRELDESLGENAVRLHLVRVLTETISLWPAEPVAEKAAVRLAEEFVAALEIGDLETASRLAPLMASTRGADARKIACEAGVMAAVAAFGSTEPEHQPTLTAIISTLGERALPAVLECVATEDSQEVRKRLMEIIIRLGERAIPFVRPLLDDARWYVVRNAIFLLRRLEDREIAPMLKARLPQARPQIVAEILKVLVALEDRDWLPLLFREVDGDDVAHQAVAVDVAAQIPHPAVVRGLADRLRQRLGMRLRETVALDLIRALGRLRDPAALPVLRQVLDVKQWRVPFSLDAVRVEAATAVARLAGAEADRLAASLAQDRDPKVSAAVKRVQREVRGVRRSEA